VRGAGGDREPGDHQRFSCSSSIHSKCRGRWWSTSPSSSAWRTRRRYTEREKTAYEHAWEIEHAFGYHKYDDPGWSRKFRTFLYGRAWTHAEGPVALFNHATAWLRRHRVLLPGVSVLARQVSAARVAAEDRLHATVARATFRADPALPPALGRPAHGARRRTSLGAGAAAAAADALDRDGDGACAGPDERDLRVQAGPGELVAGAGNRLATLAQYGMYSKAAALERTPEPRRTALVTAVVRNLEAQAIDDALDCSRC
jgi:hypothetical protein